MKFIKKFELGWNILIHSKLRSWLTIIGIIIGIGAVVAIVSISNGAQKQLEEQMSNFNTNQITVTPGASRAMGFMGPGGGGGPESGGVTTVSDEDEEPILTNKDILSIGTVDNVDFVAKKISGSEEVIYSSKSMTTSITGIEPEYYDDLVDEELVEGRGLTKSDTNVVIVSNRVSSAFGTVQINRQMVINGKNFKVVGILEGGNGIYMPINAAVTVIEDAEINNYDNLVVFVKDADLVENTTTDIEKKLMLSRGILKDNEKDFSVSNMVSMQDTISSTLNTLALFLGAIAAISLLVGGIGIANTMFTSVLEKTKEIGILKAIGAKNGDILTIFLINAGLIGFVGGIGGIIVGSGASILISYISGINTATSSVGGGRGGMMGNLFSSTSISLNLILFALFFSIVIGMIAGAIPARRASKLKPVDALRYE